ncbi:MAG TPA: GIY-YIG nuclease family protein [Rubricoccaceae bacterium]
MAAFYVYLLASRSRALYVGVTNDVARRVAEHRMGLSVHTARYHIDRLVRVEAYPTARDAIAREKQLKAWRREKKTALVATDNPTWRDLESSRYS